MSGDRTDLDALARAGESNVGENPPGRAPAERRQRARLVSAGILAAVVAVFALINLND